MNLVGLLVALLVLAVVIYVIKLVMDMLPLPEQVKLIAYLILGLIGLLVLLNLVGITPGSIGHWRVQ